MYEYKRNMYNLLSSVTENTDKWNTETVITASGLQINFKTSGFWFKLFPYNILCNISNQMFYLNSWKRKRYLILGFALIKLKNSLLTLSSLEKSLIHFGLKLKKYVSFGWFFYAQKNNMNRCFFLVKIENLHMEACFRNNCWNRHHQQIH